MHFSLEMMEQLGTRWHLRFGALKKYMDQHGQEPSKDTEYGGFKIGAWLESQRSAYRKGRLNEDREELLSQLGVRWGSYKDTERSWVRYMVAATAFFDKNGKLPSQGEESPEGLKIGVWLNHQRRLFRKGALREDRKTAIDNLLGDILNPGGSKVDRNLAAYKDYVEKTGKQPERRTFHEGVSIGNWLVNSIRPQKNKLPAGLVEKLDALGFVWETGRKKRASNPASRLHQPGNTPPCIPQDSTGSWYKNFECCRALMRTLSRKIDIADTYRTVKVGEWFQVESQIYAAGAFSEIKRLLFRSLIYLDENHGSVLKDWFWNYSHCLEFVLSNPTAPMKDFSSDGIHFGEWFEKQVGLMEKGALLVRQENAIQELLTIRKDRSTRERPSD